MSSYTSEPVRSIHHSKRDLWLVVLLWAMAILLHAAALVVVLAPCPPGLRIALPIILLLVSYLMLWILYGTRYLLTDLELRIACGPFRWRVPYDDITPRCSA